MFIRLCTGLLTQEQKDEISYFIAVRSFIRKTTKKGVPDLKEINERISKMLEEAILGDEVLVLTEATSSESFDLLNEENIGETTSNATKKYCNKYFNACHETKTK